MMHKTVRFIIIIFLLFFGAVSIPAQEKEGIEYRQITETYEQGLKEFQDRNFEQALGLFNQCIAIEIDEDSGQDSHYFNWYNALYYAGLSHYFLGEKEEAIEKLLVVYRRFPASGMIPLNIAVMYSELGRPESSIRILTDYIREQEDSAAVYNALAYYYGITEDYVNMERSVRRVYRLDASLLAEKDAAAYSIILRSIDSGDIKHAFFWHSRLLSSFKHDQRPALEEYSQQLRQRQKDRPVSAFFLWTLYKALGSREEQDAVFPLLTDKEIEDRIIALYDTDRVLEKEAYYYAGCYFSRRSRFEEAVSFLEKAFISSMDARETIAADPDLSLIEDRMDSEALLEHFTPLVMTVQARHSGNVNDCVYSSDGSFLLTAGEDKSIRLWNSEGKLVRVFNGHVDRVNRLCFLPGGELFLSASDDKSVKLWRIDGKNILTLRNHDSYVKDVTVTSDGKLIISCGWDGKINVSDRQGRLISSFEDYPNRKESIAVDRSDSIIATGNYDGSISLHSISGEKLRHIDAHEKLISDVEALGDNTFMSASRDGSVKIWDFEGSLLEEYRCGESGAYGVYGSAASADGSLIACNTLISAYLWDRETGVQLESDYYFDNNECLTFSPGGRLCDGAEIRGIDGTVLHTLGYEIDTRSDVAVSRDGSFIAGSAFSSGVDIWDIDLKRDNHFGNNTLSGICIDNADRIICGRWTGSIGVWSRDGRLLYNLNGEQDRVYDVAASADARYIAGAGRDGSVKVWDLQEKTVKEMHPHEEPVRAVAFSPDGNYIASGDEGSQVFVEDSRGEIIARFSMPRGFIGGVRFSPDGRILAANTLSYIRLWTMDGSEVLTLYGDMFSCFDFSPCGNYIASGSWDNSIRIWDLEGREHKVLDGHTAEVNALAYMPDGRRLVSASDDGTTLVWNLETGKSVRLLSNTEEWIAYSSDGYFDSSVSGGRLVGMSRGDEVYGIDQFAVWNNRPDILLERIGSTDSALIDHFKSRYQRRLEKAGLDQSIAGGRIHVPTAAVHNLRREGKFAEIEFVLEDKLYDLQAYNVYVNNVPLFGAYGKKISGRRFSGKERIELTGGQNKIEVACLNDHGAESYRSLNYVYYDKDIIGSLYFLGFGVSRYHDPALDLKYAAKDAEDLASLFKKMEGSAFRHVYTKLYLNEDVTPQSILNAKSFLENAVADDTLILFIAGHGIHERTNEATYYFVTHNADLRDIPGTCADFESIESLLHNIRPRRKLFLMDTCESGEAEEEPPQSQRTGNNQRSIRPRTIRGISLHNKNAGQAPRSYLFEKDRFIYNNLARRSGAVVFSSSGGGEFSYEWDEIENGIFTEEIINAFTEKHADTDRNGEITVHELKDYVRREVSRETEGLQNPTVDRDNIHQKFGFLILQSFNW